MGDKWKTKEEECTNYNTIVIDVHPQLDLKSYYLHYRLYRNRVSSNRVLQ